MMQLYKKRDFGDLISDTFEFIKLYGRNFFKHYLTINGGILLVLVLLFVIGFKDIISLLYQGNMGDNFSFFEDYFAQNPEVFIITCSLIVIITIILGVINYAYPVVYLHLAGEQNRKDFKLHEILDELKKRTSKLAVFSIFSIFIFLPIALVTLSLSIFLILLLIGIFLLIVWYPTIINIINFTLFDYLTNDKGIFEAFKTAFQIQFSKKYWIYMSCTLVINIIIQVLLLVFNFLGTFMLVFAQLIGSVADKPAVTIVIVLLFYVIMVVCSLIFQSATYICTGLMYFDFREDLQRKETAKEIDLIGRNNA